MEADGCELGELDPEEVQASIASSVTEEDSMVPVERLLENNLKYTHTGKAPPCKTGSPTQKSSRNGQDVTTLGTTSSPPPEYLIADGLGDRDLTMSNIETAGTTSPANTQDRFSGVDSISSGSNMDPLMAFLEIFEEGTPEYCPSENDADD